MAAKTTIAPNGQLQHDWRTSKLRRPRVVPRAQRKPFYSSPSDGLRVEGAFQSRPNGPGRGTQFESLPSRAYLDDGVCAMLGSNMSHERGYRNIVKMRIPPRRRVPRLVWENLRRKPDVEAYAHRDDYDRRLEQDAASRIGLVRHDDGRRQPRSAHRGRDLLRRLGYLTNRRRLGSVPALRSTPR